jgi:hypothetical protein
LRAGLRQVHALAQARDAAGLFQNVALRTRHWLAGDVVDHMMLQGVGRNALDSGAVLIERQQRQYRFAHFGAIKVAATG